MRPPVRYAYRWRELFTPKFWEYRRAMTILRRAKEHIGILTQEDFSVNMTLTFATWRVEDYYYGIPFTEGNQNQIEWPLFFQKEKS